MKNWYVITGINGELQMYWLYEIKDSRFKVDYNERGERYSLIALTGMEAMKLRLELRKLSKKFKCKLKLTRMSAA